MHPQSYLELAARHENNTLAAKEGIPTRKVVSAIDDVAHYLVNRDCKLVISVFAEPEKGRLRNGVQKTHKG